MSPQIKVPKDWKVFGPGLPDFNPIKHAVLTLDQSMQLGQDLWDARSPDGKFSLDIGWYDHINAGSPDAVPLDPSRFMVALTENERSEVWEECIVASFESRDLDEVIAVANLLLKRFGENDESPPQVP